MKKSIISLFIVFFAINCSLSQNNILKFKGKITNPNSDEAYIKDDNGYIKYFKISEAGEFADTLNIPKDGTYTFSDGRETSAIYLEKDFDLTLSLNTEKFDETINYSGVGAGCNNYLAKKYMINEVVLSDYSVYKLDEDGFLNTLDSVQTLYTNLISSVDNITFVVNEKKVNKYDYLYSLSVYESYHGYFTQNFKFEASDKFKALYSNIDFTIEDDYTNFTTYMTLVNSYYLRDIILVEKMDSVIAVVNSIKQNEIRNGVYKAILSSYFTITNDNLNQLNTSIKKNCTDKTYLETFASEYKKLESLLPGNLSPKFSYKDVNGKQVSLDDFKGKLVYIDVWATWCRPCIGEIPSLKKLEEDYHGKDIVFVSISVDSERDFEKWKKMVADKELKGYQLYADKSWKSDFIQAYQIKGIPTFILIDGKGNIVSASAKRPSNPEIRTIFDKLLN